MDAEENTARTNQSVGRQSPHDIIKKNARDAETSERVTKSVGGSRYVNYNEEKIYLPELW